MEENLENRIIHSFFGKRFSRKGKQLFGAWLSAEGNSRSKEDALQQVWDECKDASSPYTETDWARLSLRAAAENDPVSAAAAKERSSSMLKFIELHQISKS